MSWYGGTCGIMVIGLGIVDGDISSNPEQGW